MTELLIGTGGWAYFQIPGLRSLKAYSRAFNFVEVNSTFYEIPSYNVVDSWRCEVPSDFKFAVRCHKDVTHKYLMEPTDEALQIINTMIEVCNLLKSEFLVLETPSTISFTKKKIKSISHFFESVDLKETRTVWEIRGTDNKQIPLDLVALMQDYNIIHCVDLSRQNPVIDSDTIYTRVFGKGQGNIYQFSDEELVDIDAKIKQKEPTRTAMSFHNVKMYKDAARFKIYKETGKFFPVTSSKGQQSLREVLTEDVKFPITRKELIKDQGWKVIDLTENKRVHASTLLEKLPEKKFKNIKEVLNNLQQT